MKFGHLKEYNTRNIFLEKSYTKCGGKLFRGPFLKNQNWVYLWISNLKSYIAFFILCEVEAYRYILKLSCEDHLLLPHIKHFEERKRGLELVSLSHFLHDFWRKVFHIIFHLLINHSLVAFTSWDIGRYMYRSCWLTRLRRHKFWN